MAFGTSLFFSLWAFSFLFPTLGYFRAECPGVTCSMSGYQNHAWLERFWQNHPESEGFLVDGYQRKPDPLIVIPVFMMMMSPLVLEVVFRW